MRKIYYLLLLFFSFSVLSAQEKLSKEEKARREKNIQAGNPFAKYGSKAPVATLSKGKYLEVHDLDSIVTIGTSRWHVDNKKIVGDIIIDSLNVDAQPIGDAPGRWMSPDPLSEEFPEWSPYTMCYNNPIKFVDPDGRAAVPGDDIYIYKDDKGKIVKTEIINTGEDTPNRLFVQDVSATKDTENRKEHSGSYFEMQMIASSEYSEEDYKSPFFGSSQFDKDRNAYITVDGGDYSDKNWFERLGESISDDPVTVDDLKTVLSRKGGSSNGTLGARKGERGQTAKPSGTDNPFKKMKPDPSNSKRVIMKDANGKTKSVSKPEGFDEYWSKK